MKVLPDLITELRFEVCVVSLNREFILSETFLMRFVFSVFELSLFDLCVNGNLTFVLIVVVCCWRFYLKAFDFSRVKAIQIFFS